MYQLVKNSEDIQRASAAIFAERYNGLDTETYGAEWDDQMFALQIATDKDVWYYNFHDYSKNWHPESVRDDVPILDIKEVLDSLALAFSDEEFVWFIHNAKFDLRRLAQHKVYPQGGIHCTQMQERFVYNQHMFYSFDACLKRRGMAKDDAVSNYITQHKLWTGTGKKKRKHYDQVPFDIMFEYGCSDAERVRILGLDQRKELEAHAFYHNDLDLQKVAYAMEEIGITVRTDYAQGGLEYEREQQRLTAERLSYLAGEPFRSGPTWLRGIFDKHQVPYRTNPKTGNPIFDKHALDEIDHPIAGLVRQYRKHEKYAGTYYQHYAVSPLIHAEIKLHGTDTGRFSYADPNLQQVPKEETLDEAIEYQVRGCFTPRSIDHLFVMVDFNQQEFRLLLDYAGEMELIRRINEHGEDVHQATADLVGCTRKHAKTINFGLLYGMGAAKLAKALGITLKEAQALKALYFAKLPKVKRLIEAIIKKAERQRYLETWVGRKLWVPAPHFDKDSGSMIKFEYVMPNHLIQGGCGDIARMAMPKCHNILRDLPQSNMLIQVHDELLFEIHKNDLSVVPELVKAMENTYRPFNGMRLTCGAEHSYHSWGKRDILEGVPQLIPAN